MVLARAVRVQSRRRFSMIVLQRIHDPSTIRRTPTCPPPHGCRCHILTEGVNPDISRNMGGAGLGEGSNAGPIFCNAPSKESAHHSIRSKCCELEDLLRPAIAKTRLHQCRKIKSVPGTTGPTQA